MFANETVRSLFIKKYKIPAARLKSKVHLERLMKIILAQPRGFCAGVERAIEIVERAPEVHGAPIYVRHEDRL